MQHKNKNSNFSSSRISKRQGDHVLQSRLVSQANRSNMGNPLDMSHTNYAQGFQHYQVVMPETTPTNYGIEPNVESQNTLGTSSASHCTWGDEIANLNKPKSHPNTHRASSQNVQQSQHWSLGSIQQPGAENLNLWQSYGPVLPDNVQSPQPFDFGVDYREKSAEEFHNSRSPSMINSYNQINQTASTMSNTQQMLNYHRLSHPPLPQSHLSMNYMQDTYQTTNIISQSRNILQQPESLYSREVNQTLSKTIGNQNMPHNGYLSDGNDRISLLKNSVDSSLHQCNFKDVADHSKVNRAYINGATNKKSEQADTKKKSPCRKVPKFAMALGESHSTEKNKISLPYQEIETQQNPIDSCVWPLLTKKVLLSFTKFITADQIHNKKGPTNPLLRYILGIQESMEDSFSGDAKSLITFDCGEIEKILQDEKVAQFLRDDFTPSLLVAQLIKRGKMPKKPTFLTSNEKYVSVATFENNEYTSGYTAEIMSGQTTKLLCVTKCKCCYFDSVEKWVESCLKETNPSKKKCWKDCWKQVLIQVPLIENNKNVWILSHVKDGVKTKCAFAPLYQYVNVMTHVGLHKTGKVKEIEKKLNYPEKSKITSQPILDTGSNDIAQQQSKRIIFGIDESSNGRGKTEKVAIDDLKKSDSHLSTVDKQIKKDKFKEKASKGPTTRPTKSKKTRLEFKTKSELQPKRDILKKRTTGEGENKKPGKKIRNEEKITEVDHTTHETKLHENVLKELSYHKDLRSKVPKEYPNAPLGEIWMSPKTYVPETDIDYSLLGRRWVWDEGHFADAENVQDTKKRFIPECENTSLCRAYCNCGAEGDRGEKVDGGRTRRSVGNSVKLGHVLTELASGKLNRHTLVSCEAYSLGPELDQYPITVDTRNDVLAKLVKEKGGSSQVQPFTVRVSPDAACLADLHAHLAMSEVIGLLGGRWEPEERCVYIQAAFPCKAADSGSTDVEMDPVSQVIARDCISSHGLKVVGWYHSHPSFQPDPSVTDIENQGNYQRLFASEASSNDNENKTIPFVGLIIGTWDGRNPSSRSVMRWFHVTPKETGNLMSIKNQSSENEIVDFSLSGGAAKERVLFPMKLQVTHRRFRWENMNLEDGERFKLTSDGKKRRLERKVRLLDKLRDEKRGEIEMWKNIKPTTSAKKKNFIQQIKSTGFCKEIIAKTDTKVSSTLIRDINSTLQPCNRELTEEKDRGNNDYFQESIPIAHLHVPYDPLKAFKLGEHVTISTFKHQIPNGTSNLVAGEMNSSNIWVLKNKRTVVTNYSSAIILPSKGLHNEESLRKTVQDGHEAEEDKNKFEDDSCIVATPLSFSIDEFNALNNTIHADDEEIARIIWDAVEREQHLKFSSYTNKMSYVGKNIKMTSPASSSSILKLLLQDHWFYLPKSHAFKDGATFSDDDITMIHGIDALFSHYASNKKRIEIHDVWSCNGNSSSNGLFVGSNTKFRKGHKICISILRWTKSMQLSGFQPNTNATETGQRGLEPVASLRDSISKLPAWDHENDANKSHFVKKDGSIHTIKNHECEFSRQNTPIKFTAEIMRLFAARWREQSKRKPSSIRHKRKRGRPRKFR